MEDLVKEGEQLVKTFHLVFGMILFTINCKLNQLRHLLNLILRCSEFVSCPVSTDSITFSDNPLCKWDSGMYYYSLHREINDP